MSRVGVPPSKVTFGILLDACVKDRDLARSRIVFDDLVAHGLRPNAVHYTTFIKGLALGGCLSEATQLLQEMLDSTETAPDLVTYSTLVKAHADRGDVKVALAVFDQMLSQNIRPDVVIFNIILTGCSVASLGSKETMDVFNQLISRGLHPSHMTITILLRALVKVSAWPTAIEIVSSAPSRFGIWPEHRVCEQLVQSCIQAGQHEFAETA